MIAPSSAKPSAMSSIPRVSREVLSTPSRPHIRLLRRPRVLPQARRRSPRATALRKALPSPNPFRCFDWPWPRPLEPVDLGDAPPARHDAGSRGTRASATERSALLAVFPERSDAAAVGPRDPHLGSTGSGGQTAF